VTDKTNNALNDIRAKIDALDAQIQSMISDRARLASAVRESKGEFASAVDYYRPEREAEVLRAVRERNDGPISDTEMLRLFREIMSVCLAQQEPLKIAYLGPEGTFTQQAVNRHFGHSVQALGVSGITDVFSQVESREADFGVVPVENSSQGIVSHTMDRFVDSDLKICGEIEMAIHHNLLSQAKGLADIERIYSHGFIHTSSHFHNVKNGYVSICRKLSVLRSAVTPRPPGGYGSRRMLRLFPANLRPKSMVCRSCFPGSRINRTMPHDF